jgi:hypothetical protein
MSVLTLALFLVGFGFGLVLTAFALLRLADLLEARADERRIRDALSRRGDIGLPTTSFRGRRTVR